MTSKLVTLAECPPGAFKFNGSLGFKTEYNAMVLDGPANVPGDQLRWRVGTEPEAYCMESGETFLGGAKSEEERAALMVEPVDVMDIDGDAAEEIRDEAYQEGYSEGQYGAAGAHADLWKQMVAWLENHSYLNGIGSEGEEGGYTADDVLEAFYDAVRERASA